MAHLIEAAASGRSKCRGCGRAIAKGELRFGELMANPFADGMMTLWFHLVCAAYRRPEAFLETTTTDTTLPDAERLRAEAQRGIDHHRLVRIDGVQLAPSARARCRHCREPITKGEWRISLVTFDEGVFNPAGNVHAACARQYFGTDDLHDRLFHFAPDLSHDAKVSLRTELDEGAPQ